MRSGLGFGMGWLCPVLMFLAKGVDFMEIDRRAKRVRPWIPAANHDELRTRGTDMTFRSCYGDFCGAMVVVLLSLLGPAGLAAQGSSQQQPNFLFILADDLGQHQLGCYGSKYYETPNIDHLAAQGMRFTRAYSAAP